MAFNEPRRQTEDLLLVVEEPQYRTSQEATPRAFTPSTMTTTTIVDASVAAAHVGAYVIPEDGSARDQVRQIKSISGTTATVDAAWTSTASVTSIRVWLPADVPFRTTASGSTTTIVSGTGVHASITNEPNSYWRRKGYHAIAIGGQNAGKAADISDFTNATGTLTITDAVTSTIANELWVVRKMLRPEGPPTVTVGHNVLDRRIVGFAAPDVGVPTTKQGTANFTLPVRPLPASAPSATVARQPLECGDLIAALFTEQLDTGSTSTSMSGAALVVGAGSNFTTGGFVRVNTGEVGQIRSISSNTLTMGTSHLTAGNIEVSSNAYAAAWYKRKDTGFRTFTVDFFRGGLFRQVMHGCLPTISLNVGRDNVVRFDFAYSSGEAWEYTLTRWVTKAATLPIDLLETGVPRDAKASRCLFDGVNVLLTDLAIDFGFRPVLRTSLTGANQSDGMGMTLEPVTGSFRILADEDDRSSFEDVIDRFNRRQTIDFLYQNGTAPAETFALCMPSMQLTGAPQSYQDGTGVYEATFRAVLPQATPGNSFSSLLPDFAMGFL